VVAATDRSKLYKFDDYFDERISFLINEATSLTRFINKYAHRKRCTRPLRTIVTPVPLVPVVQGYYREFLQGAHKLAVTELLAKVARRVAMAHGLTRVRVAVSVAAPFR
jgi:hypothetical protein